MPFSDDEKKRDLEAILKKHNAEIHFGGSFKDDHIMPLFNRDEGHSAMAYLEVEMNLAEARKHHLPEVKSGYDVLTVKEAEQRAGEYLTTFLREVDKETERLYPGIDKHARTEISRRRARDILECHRDSSYTIGA